MTEAFVDLTGESCEKYNLEDPNTSPMIHNGELWNLLLKSHR